MLMVGYFEGIDSEGGIARRCSDSLSLKSFLGAVLTETTPDHSTVSRTRRLIDLETHARVFTWMLEALARHGLIDGKRIGVDGTTLDETLRQHRQLRQRRGLRLAFEGGLWTRDRSPNPLNPKEDYLFNRTCLYRP